MTLFFTSDTHFGHRNILEYSGHPFESIEEHDSMLVYNWNSRVGPGDLIYHLGDFALCDEERAIKIASRLNGQKHLVFGNHDKRLRKSQAFLKHFVTAKDLDAAQQDSQRIVLCHYAMVTWNQSHRGSWQLHGHSHGSLKDDPHALRLDVGVDCWNYFPVSFEEIAKRMAKKSFRPVDHHGAKEED